VNENGDEISLKIYDNIYSFSSGFALAQKGGILGSAGLWGNLNENGEESIPFIYKKDISFLMA